MTVEILAGITGDKWYAGIVLWDDVVTARRPKKPKPLPCPMTENVACHDPACETDCQAVAHSDERHQP